MNSKKMWMIMLAAVMAVAMVLSACGTFWNYHCNGRCMSDGR